MNIRLFEDKDWPSVWEMIKPVFRAGETYAYPVDIDEKGARKAWIETPQATFVAEDTEHKILGTYYIKPNHPGPGSHVCNCGYIVSTEARNSGIASKMCEHSQQEAVSRKFKAMQFNLVVSTNTGAVRLWKKNGFEIAGTLPGAYRHSRLGFVDAFVMVKRLGQ